MVALTRALRMMVLLQLPYGPAAAQTFCLLFQKDGRALGLFMQQKIYGFLSAPGYFRNLRCFDKNSKCAISIDGFSQTMT